MKKKWLLVGMTLFLVPWLLAGCGIAQEQYDDVVADLNQASKDLQSVRSELEAAQDKVSELTSSLGKSQTELETTQNELEATEAKNSELTSSLEKAESELQAGSAELTASVQKSQAELEAAQAKVSELTSSLLKVENELETTKSEYEAFKSEVESLLLLSYDQHTALQTASLDVHSAVEAHDYEAFSGAGATVKGILADLNDVKAAKLQSLWKEAYNKPPVYTYHGWGLIYGLFDDFQRLNLERTRAIRKVLDIYYHGWLER